MGASTYYYAKQRLDELDTALGEKAEALDAIADWLAYTPEQTELSALPTLEELRGLIASRAQARVDTETEWYALSARDRRAAGALFGDLARDPTRPVV